MSEFNEFINPEKNITDGDLDNIELMVGYKLPNAFREHYLLFNGGEPENYLYFFNGDLLVVQEFFSIEYGNNSIEEHYKDLITVQKTIPDNMLPFACDPGGDYYCMDLKTGEICIFRGEYFPDLSACITVISGTIEVFLQSLTEDV